MRINKILSAVLLAALLTGGSATLIAADAKAADPKAAEATMLIEQAESARKKAASVDGEWRDTGKWIKQAQAAAKAGEYDKALKLAKKAADEALLGYEQAVSQKELRIPSYLKY